MRTNTITHSFHRSSRRGSTLLIVIALLSLLMLLAATIAFTSKLDVLTARNFGKSVQNQTSALTGVPFAALATQATLPPGPVGVLDFSFDARSVENGELSVDDITGVKLTRSSKDSTERKSATAKWQLQSTVPNVKTQTSTIDVMDASSRVNLNTADAKQLAQIISLAAANASISADAAAVARNIVAYRYGADGQPGTAGVDDNASAALSLAPGNETSTIADESALAASPMARQRLSASCEGNATERLQFIDNLNKGVDEPDEYISDIRYPSFGDDRRFQSAADLAYVKGVSARLINALVPYVTTFSISQEQRPSADVEHRVLLDLNRATAEEIYDALALEYDGGKNDMLLRQFAVNVVDARDEDRRPTEMSDNLGGYVLGLERTPFITEIYADSKTEDRDGDDGQFVELFNPWQESFILSGWTLHVGSGDYALSGILAPNSYLIVTDDYKNDRDTESKKELSGQGSFYDIFKIVSNNSSKRILEIPNLELPNSSGSVELRDDTGAVIDRLVYRAGQGSSTLNSFQRYNPAVRESAFLRATPFTRPNDATDAEYSSGDNLGEKLRNAPQDVPFTSVLELFDVYAGFADADGTKGRRLAFPVVASNAATDSVRRNAAEDATLVDARIIDLFTIEQTKRLTPKAIVAQYNKTSGESLDAFTDVKQANSEKSGTADRVIPQDMNDLNEKDLQAAAWARFAMPAIGLRQGLINVNTAGEAVLQSSGFSAAQARSIVRRRADLERDALLKKSSRTVLYNRLSDVLVDEQLWGSPTTTCQAVQAFTPVFDRLTVTSRAFLLEGHAVESTESGVVQNSSSMVSAMIAMDKPAPELVGWRFSP